MSISVCVWCLLNGYIFSEMFGRSFWANAVSLLASVISFCHVITAMNLSVYNKHRYLVSEL